VTYLNSPVPLPAYPDEQAAWGTTMTIEQEPFRIGQRVRLNELGRQRMPRSQSTTAVVVGHGQTESRIRVRFHGSANPISIHVSYLERDS